jgi:Flp pilus assembly protein TadG
VSRRHERGSVLAEFALVSAASFGVIFGIVDFSRALYMYHAVSEVARQGARHALVSGVASCAGGTPDPLQTYVGGQAPLAGDGSITVTTSCATMPICGSTSATNCSNAGGCSSSSAPYNGPGCLISVRVDYAFHFMIPLVSQITLPMTSTSTMVISQ